MKQNKFKIAITGGIGSGKSTVADIIREHGFPVFSCDTIARDVFKEKSVIEKLAHLFPDCIENGTPSRKKIADVVFSDSSKREELEKITHPAIMRILEKNLNESDSRLVFAEVPLLFEGGYENSFDCVIVVMRNKSARIEATSKRDGISAEKVQKRIENQFDYENNNFFEHTVIYNDADLNHLHDKVGSVLEKLKKL